MTIIKFDVSDSDPEKAVPGSFEDPKPGVYLSTIKEVNDGFSKGDDGQPDKTRRRLEVVYEIAEDGKYKGSRVWDYVSFSDAAKWKLDQWLQSLGLADGSKKRKGQFKLEDVVGMPIKLHIKGETRIIEGESIYRARVGATMAADDEDLEQLDGDDVVDLDDVASDDDDLGDDPEGGDPEPGYAEDDLKELSIKALGDILVNEFGVERSELPKQKDPKIAMILELQGATEDDGAEEGGDEGDLPDDPKALGSLVDEEEDEDAEAKLRELAEENELDPDDYETWEMLGEALVELIDGDPEEDVFDVAKAKLPELKAKAKELELDESGPASALRKRIKEELEAEPF